MTRRLGVLLLIAGTTVTSTLTAFGCIEPSALWDQIQVGESAIVMGRIIEYESQHAEAGDRWVRFVPVDAPDGKQRLPDATRTAHLAELPTSDAYVSLRLTLELEQDLRPLPQRMPVKTLFQVVITHLRERPLPTGLELFSVYSASVDQRWSLFDYRDLGDEAVTRLSSFLRRALELKQQPTLMPSQIARWAVDLALDPELWNDGLDSLEKVNIVVAPDTARPVESVPWMVPTTAVESDITEEAVEWKPLVEWLTDADRKRLVQAALKLDPLDDRVLRTLGLDLGAASDPLVSAIMLGVEGRLEKGDISPAAVEALIRLVLHKVGLAGWLELEIGLADRIGGTDGTDALARLVRMRWSSDDSATDPALVRHIWSALAFEGLIPTWAFRADWWRPDLFRHLQIESE